MLEKLAALLGIAIGKAIEQCAPALAEVVAEGIHRALADTVEDAGTDNALVARLRARLRNTRSESPGRTSDAPSTDYTSVRRSPGPEQQLDSQQQ